MPPPHHALDAATDASLASLGSLGGGRRHGGHQRNLSAIPEAAESDEGGSAVGVAAGGAAATRWRPALAATHSHAAATAAAALQNSPELAHPVQLRWPSPPSVGRSIATQAFYTAASEAPLPLTDENSVCCTADSPDAAGKPAPVAAAAGPRGSGSCADGPMQAPAGQPPLRSTTLCGITRQAPGRRQSVSGCGAGAQPTGICVPAAYVTACLPRTSACTCEPKPAARLSSPFAAGHGSGLGAGRWGVASLQQAQ